MGLPDALAKFKTSQSVTSKPKHEPAPPRAAEWQASGRRDGVTYHEGEAAENYYADGVTPAMQTGFNIEAALEEQRLARKAAQMEAARKQGPQQIPFRPSPSMSQAFFDHLERQQQGKNR